MGYKVVKYRLNFDGTIPNFLKTGGIYAIHDKSTSSPRDHVMISIADDGADISGSEGEITSKDALTAYLTDASSGNGWKQMKSDGTKEDFEPATAATKIWDNLTVLNGG